MPHRWESRNHGIENYVRPLVGDHWRGNAPAPVCRPALVRSGEASTYVVPGDHLDRDRGEALLGGGSVAYGPTNGNEIEYLIDGSDTFRAMAEAISTLGIGRVPITQQFLVLIGWVLQGAFSFPHVDPANAWVRLPTFYDVVEDVAARGVHVYLLLWGGHPTCYRPNLELVRTAAARFARLENVHVIPDFSCRLHGSHHQKLMLVSGSQGLIGFYGGVDINADRLGSLEDTHARVKGPLAAQLLDLARERWTHAAPRSTLDVPDLVPESAWMQSTSDANRYNRQIRHGWRSNSWANMGSLAAGGRGGTMTGAEVERAVRSVNEEATAQGTNEVQFPSTPENAAAQAGHMRARLTQTVGNPRIRSPSDAGAGILHAIEQARRFIYVEDQYFCGFQATHALARALSRVAHLTVMVPAEETVEGNDKLLTRRGIAWLLDAAPTQHHHKIHIYQRTDDRLRYIHSKLWIIDDELAIVGSANCSGRGFEKESELMVKAVDRIRAPHWQVELAQARRLRMKRWRTHLECSFEEIWDGVSSHWLWRRAAEGGGPAGRIQSHIVGERPPGLNWRRVRELPIGERWTQTLGQWVQAGVDTRDFLDPPARSSP